MKRAVLLVALAACDQGRFEPPPIPSAAAIEAARDERARAMEAAAPRLPTSAEYRTELTQLGGRVAASIQIGLPEGLAKEGEIPAYGPCLRPSAAQKRAMTKTLAAWAKAQIGEAPAEDVTPTFGCVTPAEAVLSHELFAAALRSHAEKRAIDLT